MRRPRAAPRSSRRGREVQGRASAAEAEAATDAAALAEAEAEARGRVKLLQQFLRRAEERAAKMKELAVSRPCSASGPTPYPEAEIEEFESTIGDLEAQVRALKKENKADAEEHERLSKAVANFGDKYKELSSARAAKERLERRSPSSRPRTSGSAPASGPMPRRSPEGPPLRHRARPDRARGELRRVLRERHRPGHAGHWGFARAYKTIIRK